MIPLDVKNPESLMQILSALPDEKIELGMVASAICLVAWEYIVTLPLSFR